MTSAVPTWVIAAPVDREVPPAGGRRAPLCRSRVLALAHGSSRPTRQMEQPGLFGSSRDRTRPLWRRDAASVSDVEAHVTVRSVTEKSTVPPMVSIGLPTM
jgi:hypothetical protein